MRVRRLAYSIDAFESGRNRRGCADRHADRRRPLREHVCFDAGDAIEAALGRFTPIDPRAARKA